ncbi:MAG: LTA synthase family protein [Ruminococcaceae bacterium]|nr:LTA synthase family protein [Oscillospiraceae bacterium]
MNPQINETRTGNKIGRVLLYVMFGFLLLISVAGVAICIWYKNTFDLEFKALLYVMSSPLQGTGAETVKEVITAGLPPMIAAAIVYVIAVLLIERKVSITNAKAAKWLKRAGALLCVFSLVFSLVFAVYSFRLPKYIALSGGETSFYEEYYVDPDSVKIVSEGKPKNLIYIYLESMESTYASVEEGGRQQENYMPYLTVMAKDNVSFTEKTDGNLGGFISPQGTGWTVAALLATSSGIPFSFPLGENGNNNMSKEKYFASGLTTLGDILHDKGYTQVFMCGSNIEFGGRDKYYIQHGSYDIYDLETARNNGDVPKDYHNGFWGFEDNILFDIAKRQITSLAAGDDPFNFTMLTVDAHHNAGYICDLCGDDYDYLAEKHAQTANVITCIDKQVAEFVDWCKMQPWYEDTVIVISGDHPRMDIYLVSRIPYAERTVYNCFINSAVEPAAGYETGRTWTAFDMFPSTLAAMGFEIRGERLGLGTNMFSGLPTLAEELGFDYLETEIQKFSAYYINEFCPELADRVVETEPVDTGVPAE